MPVFKSGKGLAPGWCEMKYFEIVRLSVGEKHKFERRGKKEKLIVGEGKCGIAFDDQKLDVETGANLDLGSSDGSFQVVDQ